MAPAAPRQLSGLIDELSRGEEPAAASLTLLSDLDRHERDQLRTAWPSIPPGLRVTTLLRAMDLAEEDIDLDFTHLGLIGLDDELAYVREAAAEILDEAPQRAVAARLLSLLTHDPDQDARAAAAASLRQFVVLRELGKFDEQLGDAIVQALKAAFEDGPSSPALRASALESLGACSLPCVGEFIVEGYNSDDRDIRLAALTAMGDSAEERWLDYIVEQFYSDDPEFRCAAIFSAAEVGSEEAVEPLAPLLTDSDADVVTAAIAALGEIGGGEALEVLRDFASHAAPEFEALVAEAIQAASEYASGRPADADEFDE